MFRTSIPLTLLALVACQAEAPPPPAEAAAAAPAAGTTEWKIWSATKAAPEAIAANAAVLDWPAEEGGEMVELRAGTNGWTCLPDMAHTPEHDPMCLDGAAMQWAGAWMTAGTPGLTSTGLAYMLEGGWDASNTDPFAKAPPEGQDWVVTGPHIMIFPVDPASLDGMSTDPTSGEPYVMFAGTPYAHVMMPVK